MSGIPFSHMLFFDDEKRNVMSVSQLGKNMALQSWTQFTEYFMIILGHFSHLRSS